MSRTEYRFDGLDALEQQLSRMIEEEYPPSFGRWLSRSPMSCKERSRKRLRAKRAASRTAGRSAPSSEEGDTYYIEVYTNVDAEPVEYGHRNRGGRGFVPGKHMMELSLEELEQALPGYLQEWLSDFISTHDL